ncbi:15715_t:CDS:2, partial [Dentiscutata erythropus]
EGLPKNLHVQFSKKKKTRFYGSAITGTHATIYEVRINKRWAIEDPHKRKFNDMNSPGIAEFVRYSRRLHSSRERFPSQDLMANAINLKNKEGMTPCSGWQHSAGNKFSHSLAQVGVGVQLTLSNVLWVGLIGSPGRYEFSWVCWTRWLTGG